MERTLSKYAILSVNARNRHTQLKALNVLVNDTLKLSSLTGDASDTEAVQGVGGDSGTRIQALDCSGIGVETALKQYQPLCNGAAAPVVLPPAPGTQITGAALWPAVTLNAISHPQGDSGYNSVANVEGPGAAGFTAQYLHWGYEHLFYRITFGGNGQIVAGQLVSDLTTTSASMSGTLLSGMKVSRGQRWWRNLDGWQTWQLTFDRQSVKSG
jgi:hypothetical protein